VSNPWLEIPLEDYEAHMSLPAIDQAALITRQLGDLLVERAPTSVAVIGCAGGNGFERLIQPGISRVVGVDINAQYIDAVRQRYAVSIEGLQLVVADIQSQAPLFDPVDLIYAALVLEYVDVPAALRTLRRHCRSTGLLATLTQLPNQSQGPVSPSPYKSLEKLRPAMRLVANEHLVCEAMRAGFSLHREQPKVVATPAGKQFALHTFQPAPCNFV
jgi:SAM-dependent methyltransferase